MIREIFPDSFYKLIIKYVNLDNLNEIRIRINEPIVFSINASLFFISQNGLTKNIINAMYATKEFISKVFYIISENSVYAINNQLKEGYVTVKNGIRIGLSGEVVYENEKIITIKNISYINVRIPHKVDDCSKRVFDYLIGNPFYNTLIISPPGQGKTTFLRDLICQIYKNKYTLNSLVLDERFEIAGNFNGVPQFNLGPFVDIISGCKKSFGFETGIRVMNPDVIFTDEIATYSDINSINYAVLCGVSVVATVHGRNIEDLKNKDVFKKLLELNYFKRFIVLSKYKGIGTIEGLYDEKFNLLYRD